MISRHPPEPALEAALAAVKFELGKFLGDGDDRFLRHFVGLLRIQSGPAADLVDQAPVVIEKMLPAGRIGCVPQPGEEAAAGGQEGIGLIGHGNTGDFTRLF